MAAKILLVDDSPVMRKMVSRSLRQAGLDIDEVLEAGNGKEALTVLQANAPDVVICDWNMPEMNGLEFVQEARKTYQTPIIMLTTEGTEDRINQAISAGANAYVTKPFTPDKLGEKINLVLAA